MKLAAIVCAASAWLLAAPAPALAQNCSDQGVQLQVLGSGGPETQTGRAGSSYLIWVDGKARALIDSGGGSALRFGQTRARMADLDVILFTHLHADHSADLPALVHSSYFEDRKAALPIFGPSGNKYAPGTVTFVRTLFDTTRGAYRYLSDFVSPQQKGSYKLRPRDIDIKSRDAVSAFSNSRLRASAIPVRHGPIPALAWRIDIDNKGIVFSGDGDGDNGLLEKLAGNASLFVAHNAVPTGATGVERSLHMPPPTIGQIAQRAGVRRLVLSHRMLRTLGQETATLAEIKKSYPGPVDFADDLACFAP